MICQKKRNGEFDIVTLDSKGYIFYKVKYGNKRIDKKMIEDEILDVKSAGLECYKYVFFSKSGFADISMKNKLNIHLMIYTNLFSI